MFNMKLGTPEPKIPTRDQPEMLETTRQAEALEPPLNASSPNEIASHFDDLIDEAAADIGLQAAPVPQGLMGHDQFHLMFCGGFNGASFLTGLKSLKVDKSDEAAYGASKATYDTILEIPSLHFMLKPGGKWMERGFAMFVFVTPMARALNAELDEKRRARKQNSPGAGAVSQPVSPPTPPAPGEPDALAAAALTGSI